MSKSWLAVFVFNGDFLGMEWGKLIGDVPASTAILDRFLQQAEVVQITGKSYRLEKAKKTLKGTIAPTGSDAEEM